MRVKNKGVPKDKDKDRRNTKNKEEKAANEAS